MVEEEEDQETNVWRQLAAEYEAENGEEETTQEEQEYLLDFCDPNRLCPVRPKLWPSRCMMELMIVLRRAAACRSSGYSKEGLAVQSQRKRIDQMGNTNRLLQCS